MSDETTARFERDVRLKRTDRLMHLTDHPKKAEILALRTALRDYPNHSDWPSLEKMPDPYPYL